MSARTRKVSLALVHTYMRRAESAMRMGDFGGALLWLESALAWCRGVCTPEEIEKHEELIEGHMVRLRALGPRPLANAEPR